MRNIFLASIYLLFNLCTVTICAQQTFKIFFDPSTIKIQKESISTSYSEYSPCFYQDGIIFSSNRKHAFGVKTFSEEDKDRLDDMYYSKMDKSHSLEEPHFLNSLNTRMQEGSASYDSIHNILYYCATFDVKKQHCLAIYSTQLNAEKNWEAPKIVLFAGDTFSYFHPMIFNDGNSMILASDKTGGFGQIDLYITQLADGIWSQPANLGKNINTSKNDAYPFIDYNGDLFFASKGHKGYGGYDIFVSENFEGQFEAPINAGPVINTKYDDFGICLNEEGKFGYLSSNRDKISDDDLYKFEIVWPEFNNCFSYVNPKYCYDLSDEGALESADAEGFYFEWDLGDGNKKKGISVNQCYNQAGTYQVELNIMDISTGTLFMNQNGYELPITEKEMLHLRCPDTIIVGDKTKFDSWGSNIKDYVIQDYFWNPTPKHNKKGAAIDYTFNKPGVYEVKLGVSARSTTSNSNVLNYFCTTKTIVVISENYTPQAVIKKEILTQKGPIQKNASPNPDLSHVKNPMYSIYLGSSKQLLNTEIFNIKDKENIKVVNEDTIYRYLYKSEKRIKDLIPAFNVAKASGNDEAFVLTTSNGKVVPKQISPKKEFRIFGKRKPKTKTEIITKNTTNETALSTRKDVLVVYFEKAQSFVDSSYFSTINKIGIGYIDDEYVGVKLIGISTNIGTPEYNLILARRRAEAVENYLLSKKIPYNVIKTYYYSNAIPPDIEKYLSKTKSRRCVIIIPILK